VRAAAWRVFGAHLRFHLAVLRRQPDFWGPVVVLPAMLYVFFGAGLGAGAPALQAVVAFCVYAVGSVAFFQFGVGLAHDRASVFAAWSACLPRARWLGGLGQIAVTALFGCVAVLLVIALARLVGGHAAPVRADAVLLLACLMASLPAALMGCVLGMLVPARSASGVAMMVYLPMAYVSGLWVPLEALPEAVVTLSWAMPLRHMADLVWALTTGAAWHASVRPAVVLALWCVALAAVLAVMARRAGSPGTPASRPPDDRNRQGPAQAGR
jgi:ABC-2 type transport system permease protein